MDFGELLKAASDTCKFEYGSEVPISYNLSYLATGERAATHVVGDEWQEVERISSRTHAEFPINFEVNMGDHKLFQAAGIRVYGKKIVGLDSNGIQILGEEELLYDVCMTGSGTQPIIIGSDVSWGSVHMDFYFQSNRVGVSDIYNRIATNLWLSDMVDPVKEKSWHPVIMPHWYNQSVAVALDRTILGLYPSPSLLSESIYYSSL